MLAFLRHGRPAKGLDRLAGLTLRLVGVAGFGFAAMAAMGAFVALTVGDMAGWEGLIRVLAIMLGLGALLLAVWFIWGADRAFRGWVDRRARPVLWMGGALTGVGATFWAPYVFLEYTAPLDVYLLWLRVGMLVAGVIVTLAARQW